jgi:FHA domain/Double zinc ribbon
MRCSMCGHESPAGSSFCLNCGSSLTSNAQAFAQTPPPAPGLPSICPVCRGENPAGMKFCRSCGAALQMSSPGSPAFPPLPGAMPVPGAMPMPSAPIAAFPSPPAYGPAGGLPGRVAGNEPTMLPMAMSPALRPAQASTIACPRCGTQTPLGFAFCQQCGYQMQPAPGEPPRPQTPSSAGAPRPAAPPSGGAVVLSTPPPIGLPSPASLLAAKLDAPIDPHAGTVAHDDVPPGLLRGLPARPQTGPSWGMAVLVNRDGSDGQRFPLSGEYLIVGRAGTDVAFDDDRFLARQHARIERAADGAVRIVPMDTLNGVFRKADAPVELADGMTLLVGREVLRYERVEAEETKVHPLVRHGVALFGSPPREPWGRFVQLVPSGGYRDVRHLAGEEIVLGREEGDIVFRDDAFMSRRHAAVTWDGKRAQITDLGSSNGTFVRITGSTALRHGDHVRMGDQLLRIELGR